jgi:pyrroline-5-carboxylate reductase
MTSRCEQFGHNRFHIFPDNRLVVHASDVLILSTKPGQIKDVCDEIKDIVSYETPIISVAAAVPLSNLKEWLPYSKTIIRCMPNISCSIGEGIVPYYTTEPEVEDLMTSIFSPNRIIELDDDGQIDVSTVVSGCGPAFVAWFSDHLSRTGSTIPASKLNLMIAQTIKGTGSLLESKTKDRIIKEVASPKGATEAALNLLNNDLIQSNIKTAFDEAHHRIHNIKSQFH